MMDAHSSWHQVRWALRRDLKAHGLRDDLVRSQNKGLVELLLYPGDELIFETAPR